MSEAHWGGMSKKATGTDEGFMSQKPWQSQREGYLRRILSLLREYENVVFIGQRPYKDDFFDIFADAFQSGFCTPTYRLDAARGKYVLCKSQRPRISGDVIVAFVKEQGWIDSEMALNETKCDDVNMVRVWWDEWTYAWTRNPPKRRYKRGR